MARKQLPEPYLTLELDGQEVQRFRLDRPRTSIGRAREAEIQIAVRGVSRTHAVVVRDDAGACTLEDLGSANGTFVNGARIVKEHKLRVGDVINFLDYALRFQREKDNEVTDDSGLADEALSTDSSELSLDDAMPTEEGPALKKRTKTLTTSEGVAQKKRAAKWQVTVDDPELGSSAHTLEREVTVVGGGDASHIRLSGRRFEVQHSLFVRVEDKVLYVRLSPVNLARVNGTARMVSFLESGDEISIGGTTLSVKQA